MSLSRPSASDSLALVPRLLLDIHQLTVMHRPACFKAEFSFDPSFAVAVSVSFIVEDSSPIVWIVGRDLLRQGLVTLSGSGDVRMWPTDLDRPRTVRLELTCGDAAALFELPQAPLAVWLATTYRLVPAGAELHNVDWDGCALELYDSPPFG